jgi:hypothetical protein
MRSPSGDATIYVSLWLVLGQGDETPPTLSIEFRL